MREKKVIKIRVQVMLETGELLIGEFNNEISVAKVLQDTGTFADYVKDLITSDLPEEPTPPRLSLVS